MVSVRVKPCSTATAAHTRAHSHKQAGTTRCDSAAQHARRYRSVRAALVRCYNWSLWGFLVIILFAQVFGIFMNVVSSEQHAYFGRDPLDGVGVVSGYNDEPYADRIVACVRRGPLLKPMQVSAALRSSNKSTIVDTTGTSVSGYRIVTRKGEMAFDAASAVKYAPLCNAIGATLDGIVASCTALGYNVSRNAPLHVLAGVDSVVTTLVHDALPVLILPYWDNSYASRFVLPGVDGSACVFRLTSGAAAGGGATQYFHAINRTTREALTAAWLDRPGGVWRNGWYEDRARDKWFSDLVSTNRAYVHSSIVQRMFDTDLGGVEIDWRRSPVSDAAQLTAIEQSWGGYVSISEHEHWYNSVTILNGARVGLFLYEALKTTDVRSQVSLDVIVSNTFVIMLLVEWLVAIVVMHRSDGRSSGIAHADQDSDTAIATVGVGCLASRWYFVVLPVALLPRLKTTLAAFCALGCQFEGDARALAEAWFVVYPAVGECLLFYFGVLNQVAKLLRRRVSDVLFGPTLAFFYLLHYFRFELAQSGWLEFDGRVATVVSSTDFANLSLLDFVTTDAALRMNGNVTSLFALKLAVFAFNLVPFIWSTSTAIQMEVTMPLATSRKTTSRRSSNNVDMRRAASSQALGVEIAVAIRAATVGGLGRPFQYIVRRQTAEPPVRRASSRHSTGVLSDKVGVAATKSSTKALRRDTGGHTQPASPREDALVLLLPRYELVRIGYVVLGDAHLIATKDWLWFVLVSPLRRVLPFANARVCLYAITRDKNDGTRRVHPQPRFWSVNDATLRAVSVWDVSTQSLR